MMMFGCLFGEIKIYIPLYVLVYRAVKTDFGHFISLDKMNCVFSLNKYNNILSFWLWHLPENSAFVRKMMALRAQGAGPAPGSYVYERSYH